jgi:hypothetical protein
MGIPTLAATHLEIVNERVHRGRVNIGIRVEILAGVEQRMGRASLSSSIKQIVANWIHSRGGHIGRMAQIPVDVEDLVRASDDRKVSVQAPGHATAKTLTDRAKQLVRHTELARCTSSVRHQHAGSPSQLEMSSEPTDNVCPRTS